MNSFLAHRRVFLTRTAQITMLWLLVAAAIAAAIWALVYGVRNEQNGVYAGRSYNDARLEAVDVMALRFGGVLATHLRLGTPDVINTHLHDSAVIGTGQVRVFNMVGPLGVRYCVPIWSDGSVKTEANAVVKGCILSHSGSFRSNGKFSQASLQKGGAHK